MYLVVVEVSVALCNQLATSFADKILQILRHLDSGFDLPNLHSLSSLSGPVLWVEFSLVLLKHVGKIVEEIQRITLPLLVGQGS